MKSKTLEQAKRNAEVSRIRNVGITVETRPDWAKQQHVDRMLEMGVTRVELGVQNVDNEIYRLVGRTHTVEDVVEATRILKDAGLKIVYHVMPGMPGSDPQKDLAMFETIFTDSRFRPDMLKIYPCLVLKGTKTYDWFMSGKYKPYDYEQALALLTEVKKSVPPWFRIMRVQRDIPAQLIQAGVKRSNLRETVQENLRKQGLHCRCIRCREIGPKTLKDSLLTQPNDVVILTTKYEASRGTEIFVSAEDVSRDIIIGYLRLRIPSKKAQRSEIIQEACSVIRELHVYGPLVPIGRHYVKAWQHKGYGALLLKEAERITLQDYGLRKILVISALGTKQYYRRFGYQRDGVYMSKPLGELNA